MSETTQQRSFTVGEVSPELFARSDLRSFYSALRECLNCVPQREGGLKRRFGTTFVGEVGNVSIVPLVRGEKRYVILIPKEAGGSLEVFGFDETGLVDIRVSYPSTSGILDYFYTAKGATILLNEVRGESRAETPIAHPLGVEVSLDEDIIRIRPLGNSFGNAARETYGSETLVGTPTNIVVPSANGSRTLYRVLAVVDGEQTGYLHSVKDDVVFKGYDSDGRMKLAKNEFNNLLKINNRRYYAIKSDGESAELFWERTVSSEEYYKTSNRMNLDEDDTVRLVSLDWQRKNDDPDDHPQMEFPPGVADVWEIYKSTDAGANFGLLAAYAGSNFFDPNTDADSTVKPPPLTNPFQEDYPSLGTSYRQGTVYAGFNTDPRRIVMSRIGTDYDFNTSGNLTAASPVDVRLSGEGEREIRALSAGKSLFIGTESGEVLMGDRGSVASDALIAFEATSNGTARVKPQRLGNSVFYVHRSGRTIYANRFNETEGDQTGYDTLIFSPSRFRNASPDQLAFQKGVSDVLWVLDSDGVVHSLTFDEKENVRAWATHDFGGKVKELKQIATGKDDELLMVVERDGKHSLERLITAPVGGHFLDSNLFQRTEEKVDVIADERVDIDELEKISLIADGYSYNNYDGKEGVLKKTTVTQKGRIINTPDDTTYNFTPTDGAIKVFPRTKRVAGTLGTLPERNEAVSFIQLKGAVTVSDFKINGVIQGDGEKVLPANTRIDVPFGTFENPTLTTYDENHLEGDHVFDVKAQGNSLVIRTANDAVWSNLTNIDGGGVVKGGSSFTVPAGTEILFSTTSPTHTLVAEKKQIRSPGRAGRFDFSLKLGGSDFIKRRVGTSAENLGFLDLFADKGFSTNFFRALDGVLLFSTDNKNPNFLIEAVRSAISIPEPANEISLGLEFPARIRSMPVRSTNRNDDLMGEPVNINRVVVYTLDTPGFQVKLDGNTETDATDRTVGESMTTPIEAKTGPQETAIEGDYREEADIIIEQNRPLPLHVLSWRLEGDFIEGNHSRRRRRG